MRVAIIVQARMGSTRLPGKVLKEILERPLLSYQIERLRRVPGVDLIIVATSEHPQDEPIVDFCKREEIACFRGSEEDVLDRYLQAACAYQIDLIVRVTADCPLIDPSIVAKALQIAQSYTYVSNVHPRTFPRGQDVEVFQRLALEDVARQAKLPEEREHVTLYFNRHPEAFTTAHFTYPEDLSSYRWTVDTEEDFTLIADILSTIYPKHPNFTMEEVLHEYASHPEWKKINRSVPQKDPEALPCRFECVRPVEEDARLIMEWRNDPVTRAASFDSCPKVWETFYPTFLKSSFRFPDLPPLFILVNGKRVGFLGFVPVAHPLGEAGRCCEVSINIAPEERHKGIGKAALIMAQEWILERGYDALLAEVKKENASSIAVFTQAGFKRIADGEKNNIPIARFLAFLTPFRKHPPVFIIAEAGSNWKRGSYSEDLAAAKEMIEVAAKAGADSVKFQVFRPETIYVKNAGQTDYLASAGFQEEIPKLFANLSMPYEMVPLLAEHCEKMGIEFMASPFSKADFEAIDPFVKRHKLASYELGHLRLIELFARSKKPIIASTGAATESEISWTVDTFRSLNVKELTLLQCTAQYPASPSAMHLRTIAWLKECFQVFSGLSDHSEHPTYAPIAAVTLGATVIEKHFTLDKSLLGPDHTFALNPSELKEMVEAIRTAEALLGQEVRVVPPEEEELRSFARRGIQALVDLQTGDLLKEDKTVAILRPGKQILGIHPRYILEMEGKEVTRPIKAGEGIQWGDWE